MTRTAQSSIADQFDTEADPRVAQGIKDLGYSGYARSDFQNAMQAGATKPSRAPSDTPKPNGAFGS